MQKIDILLKTNKKTILKATTSEVQAYKHSSHTALVRVCRQFLGASHPRCFQPSSISPFLQEEPFCARLSLLSTNRGLEEAPLEACHCCSWISQDSDASWDMYEAHLPRRIATQQSALRRLCMRKTDFLRFGTIAQWKCQKYGRINTELH